MPESRRLRAKEAERQRRITRECAWRAGIVHVPLLVALVVYGVLSQLNIGIPVSVSGTLALLWLAIWAIVWRCPGCGRWWGGWPRRVIYRHCPWCGLKLY